MIDSEVARQVVPLLDGTRAVDDVMVAAGGRVALGAVLDLVAELERLGHLVEGPADGIGPATAFWDATGAGEARARERLASATVQLVGLGDVPLQEVRAALVALGVAVHAQAAELRDAGAEDAAEWADADTELGDAGADPAAWAPGNAVACVLADDYLHPALEALNRRLTEAGRPWLLAGPRGGTLWLGPVLDPPSTGCWACLAARLRENRQVDRHLDGGEGDGRAPSSAMLASSAQAAGGLIATELARLAGGARSTLEGSLITFDLCRIESRRHELMRDPACSVCGSPEACREPQGPIALAPVCKVTTAGGAHRARRAAETVAGLEDHVSPLLGAVRGLARVPLGDSEVVHCYASGYNPVRLAPDLASLRTTLRVSCAGKGRTDLQARAGALCEALERHCGVHRGDEPRVRATLADLGDEAIAPERLMLVSDLQYERRALTNPSCAPFEWVPERFDPSRPVDWTRVWSLTEQRPRAAPTVCCYYGVPVDAGAPVFWHADSNGCAAGSTLEEAILQGTLELVERDGVALWWYSRARRPGVDLDSFADPYLDALREDLAGWGRELWALDLTSDLGISTFAALSRRVDAPAEEILLGFGAHLDPRTALTRAVTELGQQLVLLQVAPGCDGAIDGGVHADVEDPHWRTWLSEVTLASDSYLAPGQPAREAGGFPQLASDDLGTDVQTCVERLARAGHELVILDQSRPAIDLRVVRTIAPGLRHFWRRLAPGRLYDVPVSLGWIDAPQIEGELNPRSILW